MLDREELAKSPTERLALPRNRRRRQRAAEPRELKALLGALGWGSVDLARGAIAVERGWDRVEGLIEPKSRSGVRTVPMPGALLGELKLHRLGGPTDSGFVFAGPSGRPFDPSNEIRCAQRAWARAGLRPLGFHEARHCYASLMIAAGVNAKALSTFMGHSSISVTLDRYGHLLPDSEREATDRLDGFLERAGGAAEANAGLHAP